LSGGKKKQTESKKGDKSFGKDTWPWEAVREVLQGGRRERTDIRKDGDGESTTGAALEDATFLGCTVTNKF